MSKKKRMVLNALKAGVDKSNDEYAGPKFRPSRGSRGKRAEKLREEGDRVEAEQRQPSDHRKLGLQHSLWTLDSSSPGSPLFLPDGAHIFQKLVSFLRAQYPAFGFREVITPTIYKESLWKTSGHFTNYNKDMFTVQGSSFKTPEAALEFKDGRMRKKSIDHIAEDEELSLKPMNCPGHCLLFAAQKRSYRDLPIRYADFSPLHRNEVSGALSGLTRVRRFHQDDGHIFCRPTQLQEEIKKTFQFLEMVYETLGLPYWRFVLSTRPDEGYVGSIDDWDMAEKALKEALDASGTTWRESPGNGAFYGPKIDVIIDDTNGKAHQTATIQLDFQLPKRFNLSYLTATKIEETPVMIHRAILGSLERFLALLIENNRGRWPFWLSPRQAIILPITDKEEVLIYAQNMRRHLSDPKSKVLPRPLNNPSYRVDIDTSDDSLAKKIVMAREKRYNLIVVIGEKNVKSGELSVIVDRQPDQLGTWEVIEKTKPGSRAPVQKDRGIGGNVRGNDSIVLKPEQLVRVMGGLCEDFI